MKKRLGFIAFIMIFCCSCFLQSSKEIEISNLISLANSDYNKHNYSQAVERFRQVLALDNKNFAAIVGKIKS